jgi:hypothetical protein
VEPNAPPALSRLALLRPAYELPYIALVRQNGIVIPQAKESSGDVVAKCPDYFRLDTSSRYP